MPDNIIRLLSDAVANQIAAGEVVQRPASVVKELLENSVDAGAHEIKLIIRDAGRTLIQVIDDGCGMSEMDARMSFERHATSKISTADDLFRIRTMGFRGEALASIAAVAHVELKTKRTEDAVGTFVRIEGSELKEHSPAASANGTSIAVKNLFYNVPARRNFLKSNAVETRHILDEFHRIALAHPHVAFHLHHNEVEVYRLPAGDLQKRIVFIFGKTYNDYLVPIGEETHYVSVNGFIGKPEFSKRTRGEQFLFVNNRYVKDLYLNHAIVHAYDEMLPRGSFPFFVVFLKIDPKHVDINIHPTKTEIKFDNEQSVYAIARSVIKKALGEFAIQPSVQFDDAGHLGEVIRSDAEARKRKEILARMDVTVKEFKKVTVPGSAGNSEMERVSLPNADTDEFFRIEKSSQSTELLREEIFSQQKQEQIAGTENRMAWQLHDKYILTHIEEGVAVIDQHAAHERVLYEKFVTSMRQKKAMSQRLLFPQTVKLQPADFAVVQEMEDEINELGFEIRQLNQDTFLVSGIPADVPLGEARTILEECIEQFRQYKETLQLDSRENLAKSLACRAAIKTGRKLTQTEMMNLIEQLFACKLPYACPHGRPVMITMDLEELDKRFGRIGHLQR